MSKIKIDNFKVKISSSGVMVGCTFVPKETVQQVLAAICKVKPGNFPLHAGVKVKVVRHINDSDAVLGKTGLVVTNDENGPLVRFPRWRSGHGEASNEWYVDAKALRIIKS